MEIETNRISVFDPGRRTGVADIEVRTRNGRIIRVREISGDDIDAIAESINGAGEVVIEDQYFGRCGRKQIVSLLRHRFTIEIIARLRHIPVTLVPAATWRAYVGAGRAGKEGYIAIAESHLRRRKLTENEAAAVCIALWRIGQK